MRIEAQSSKVVILGGTLLAFMACSRGKLEASSPSRLVAFGASSFDAGIVREGERVESDFFLENASDRSLELGEPRMSCGCTEAKLDRRTLEPGEKAKLSVAIDTANRPGSLLVSVVVSSEAPDEEALMFRISALVGRPSSIEIHDSRIDFGDLAPGADVLLATPVTIRTRWGAELDPELTWTLDGEAKDRFDVVFKQGTDLAAEGEFVTRRGELRVRFRATDLGRFQARLVLQGTGRPCDASAETLLVAGVRSGVEFSRPALFMDGLAVGEAVRATVDVTWRDQELAEGLSPECSQDWISCRVLEGGLHGLGALEIEVRPPAAGISSTLVRLNGRNTAVGSLAVTVFAR